MQNRKKLLWWLLPPLLITSTALALYSLSPLIAQKGLQNWLKKQNFSYIELDMQPPEWNSLQINNLHLEKQEGDKHIRIETGQIRVKYQLLELFLQHKLKEIELPQSDVKISYSSLNQKEFTGETVDLSAALPSQWFKKIPVDLLRIGQLNLELDYPDGTPDWRFSGALHFDHQTLLSRVHFERNNEDLGWGDVELTEDDAFHLRLLQQDTPFVVINGELYYEDNLKLSATQLFDLTGLQKWQEKLLPTEQALPEFSGSVTSIGITSFPLQTDFTPDDLLLSVQSNQVVEGQITVHHPTPQLQTVKLIFDSELSFSRNDLSLNISHKSELSAHHLTIVGLSEPISTIYLTTPKGIRINADLASMMRGETSYPELKLAKLHIEHPEVSLPQGRLRQGTVTIDIQQLDLENLQLDANLKSSNIKISVPDQPLPTFDLQSSLKLKDKKLSGSYQLRTRDLPIHFSGSHKTDLTKNDSRLSWKLKPVALKNIDQTLAPYLSIPAELSISKGSLYHNGTARFRNGSFSANLNNSIRSADLSWEDYQLQQIDWDSSTTVYPSGRIKDKGAVKLERVTTGVEITKVQTRYAYERAKGRDLLELEHVKARLLEGDISIAPVSFDPLSPELATQVEIEKMDLGAILSLEQQQGLSGEGKLSGNFPLNFSNNELSITDGVLNSLDPGGKINFLPNPTVTAYAATNAGLKMALEALENFHYEKLDIKLNYAKGGTALLNTRLKGNNPDWNNGHPVDFTINIEENIPKLLQTLQFTDKLTKTIEKRYR